MPHSRPKTQPDTPRAHDETLCRLALDVLEEYRAHDIVTIDLAGKSAMADHMIVATGRSQRHVSALADHLREQIKRGGFPVSGVEGRAAGDWVLVDAGALVIHLFRAEVRAFYGLEKMWRADAPPIVSDVESA